MKKVIITLPEKIYFLKTITDTVLNPDHEELSIYYENIIYPYDEVYDVEVKSKYGNDHKRYWRISGYSSDEAFDVTFKVYAPFGELLAEKTVTMIPVDKSFSSPFNILAIGDSMTRSVTYLEQVNSKLYNINFKGIRSFNGHLFHEGRGGWCLSTYLTKTDKDPSPFLFPKNIDNYYGNMDFYNMTKKFREDMYYYSGYHHLRDIKDGECYYSDGKLYTSDGKEISDNVEWEFNFTKYMNRYNIGHLDAVSFLFGANDLQITEYTDTKEHVDTYIKNLNKMIESIREYDPEIKIIINTPVPGADQNAWGLRSCLGSGKRYNYNMMMIGKAIIENYSDDKNIFISPMSACIDPIYGFETIQNKANHYSSEKETFQSNWVHPQKSGYLQMGDCLAAVIEKIRS